MSQRYEYRVVWCRDDGSAGRRIYQKRAAAELFLARITHDFAALGVHEDSFVCCGGVEDGAFCGCDGVTWAQQKAKDEKRFGVIESAHIERRAIGAWEAVQEVPNRGDRDDDGSSQELAQVAGNSAAHEARCAASERPTRPGGAGIPPWEEAAERTSRVPVPAPHGAVA